MYGMMKTTVYLPPELQKALKTLAARRGCSEAVLLREALSQYVVEASAPAPRLPLFRATGPSIAQNVDDALEGFGRR